MVVSLKIQSTNRSDFDDQIVLVFPIETIVFYLKISRLALKIYIINSLQCDIEKNNG